MSMSEITKAEAELYRGVDRANPPQHEKLITGWLPPEAPPEGYKYLVAILAPVRIEGVQDYMWILDYLDTDTAIFASEDHEFEVPWPWQAGFKPTGNDWDAIGIPHLM